MGLVCDGTVRVVICSQDAPLAERLERMLRRWACGECVAIEVVCKAAPAVPADSRTRLLFLDLDSAELPEGAMQEKGKAALIVISRDAGRAIRSYRWHPAAFMKPDFDALRLREAMTACEGHWRQGRVCLDSPYRRRGFRLPLGQIRSVEAAAHYCLFDQKRQTVRLRFSIDELEALLPGPPFVRCHRSFLVHLDAVERMTYTTVTLRSGAALPLGRTYVKTLREALAAWREGE